MYTERHRCCCTLLISFWTKAMAVRMDMKEWIWFSGSTAPVWTNEITSERRKCVFQVRSSSNVDKPWANQAKERVGNWAITSVNTAGTLPPWKEAWIIYSPCLSSRPLAAIISQDGWRWRVHELGQRQSIVLWHRQAIVNSASASHLQYGDNIGLIYFVNVGITEITHTGPF